MTQYSQLDYWDERYTRDPEPFEWYQRWAGLKDVLSNFITPAHVMLMLGCGNSRLSEEMYEEGYKNLTNIDLSAVVIRAMQDKYVNHPGLSYQKMDCRQLEFPEAAFNVVIDKGTLDSLLCGEASTQNAQRTLQEVSRVLSPTGVYICVSHGQPANRLTYLQRPEFGWSVKIHTVQKPMVGMTASLSIDEKDNVHYMYVCSKTTTGARAD